MLFARILAQLKVKVVRHPISNQSYKFSELNSVDLGDWQWQVALSPSCLIIIVTFLTGIDYQVKSLMVDNTQVALQLWDTAGQER